MQICVNGSFHPSTQPVIRAGNRGFRYGDGLFETILFHKGEMPLFGYHAKRLYAGMALLGFRFPASEGDLSQQIKLLCQKNGCENRGRVRITVTGGNGFITEEREKADYLIEAREMNPSRDHAVIENLGVYTDAFKSRDVLSNLKSTSALVYAQAAAYGRGSGMDDVLVLNAEKRIADSTIANLFIVKNGEVITPPLEEGCVDGVMRRWLLEQFREELKIREQQLELDDLEKADEMFLTNALRGIIHVKKFKGRGLTQKVSEQLKEIPQNEAKTTNDVVKSQDP